MTHAPGSERQLLHQILRNQPVCADLIVPNGDDAAVIDVGEKLVAVTTDAFIEERHFSRRFSSLQDIGRKAIEASASDIVAMGGRPTFALVALADRSGRAAAEYGQLYDGVYDACARLSTILVGGNLATGAQALSLTVTVLGEIVDRAHVCRRGGARPGDVLVVTGPVGASHAGLRALQAGEISFDEIVRKHCAPHCRLDLIPKIAEAAHAMIDITDGLAIDLYRICRASACGATLTAGDIPIHPEARKLAERLGEDALDWALGGGEDYELLVAMPAHRYTREFGVIIGTIDSGGECYLRRGDCVLNLPELGYDHFAQVVS